MSTSQNQSKRPVAQYLRQFRSMLAVVDAGSATLAADHMPLSASAIARAIRDLEHKVGVDLFERSARGMLPTSQGRLLAYRAQRAFKQLESAGHEAVVLRAAGAPASRVRPDRFANACSYRHLSTYVAFCEGRSELAAAQRLGVSQPAVNQSLRQLEHLLDASLFHRSSRGMRLTEAGEAVLRRVKLALSEFRQAEDDLAEFVGRPQGRIAVGSLPLSAGVLVPRTIDRVLTRHRDLNVTIVDGTYDALLYQLLHADIDVIVGALRTVTPTAEVIQEVLFDDTLSVVVRDGHPLDGHFTGDLADLAGQAWIAPLNGTPARIAFERAFIAAGVNPPDALIEVNSAVVLQALLLDSDRLALLSRRQVMRGMSAGFLSVLLSDLDQTHREIGLTMRADTDPSASLKTFIDEIRTLAKGMD